LVQVDKDTTMLVSGYEHHTWQCSGCSTVERRMTFTREKTSTPRVTMEPSHTVPAKPAQTLPLEPTQTVPVQPAQTAPVQTTVPVEIPVQPTIQKAQPLGFQTNAWAKALNKVHKRETAEREAADEAERRAQFNRFWDNLLSVPSP
jgi:hypothetical protein